MFGRVLLSQQTASTGKFSKSKSNADLLLQVITEKEEKERSLKLSAFVEVRDTDTSYWYIPYCWRKLVKLCHDLVYGKYGNVWLAVIIIACVLSAGIAGWNTYPTTPEMDVLILRLNDFILSIFLFEILLKVIAAGSKPWTYVTDRVHGGWNSFDFIVTVLSIPGVAGKNSSFVKIFRLFRLLEQLQQIPAMKAIVMGLIAGIKSIVYILMLLLLVFYLYAVLGVFAFQANNPFFFSSVPVALISLFRGMTLENWDIMMFIDAYGCDIPDTVYTVANDNSSWTGVSGLYQCRHAKAKPLLATLFWVSFVVIAAFVVLSLFIGVITLHMQDSINTVRLEREEVRYILTVDTMVVLTVIVVAGGKKEAASGTN
jgi:voltage-gated sodium channel